MIHAVTLREHERVWRDGAPGVPAGAKCLPNRAFEDLARAEERRADDGGMVFQLGRHCLKAQSWVGVVRVRGAQIEILPKTENVDDEVDRTNLLEMLRYAGALPVRAREVASLSTRRAPLDDLLVEMFAGRLEQELVRGVDRGYRQQEKNLRVLRGRLQIPRHVAINAAHRERFLCRFDEFEIDTDLSRLLKAVARHLARHTRSEHARQVLGRALLVLDEVQDVTDVRALLGSVHIHRQNNRFSDLVTFAELVATNMSPSFRAGDLETFSLLFPMERVFEGFLAGFIAQHVLPDLGSFRLRRQAIGFRPALLRSRVPKADVLFLKPDLLFEADERIALVADTKWKLLQEKRRAQGISPADLYQLHAYLTRYEARRGLLLFPVSVGATDTDLDFLGSGDAPNGVAISVRTVNLAVDLAKRSGRDALKLELLTILKKVLAAKVGDNVLLANAVHAPGAMA